MALTITRANGQLTTSLATMYTCPTAATNGAIIKNIQLCNINTSSVAQPVSIKVFPSGGTSRYVVYNVSIPAGSSFIANADVIYMRPSDVVQGIIESGGTTLNVDFFISVEEYS